MPKKILVALAVSLAIGVSGCGMRGGLVMPPGPAPEPVLGNPKPAPPIKSSAIMLPMQTS